MATEPAFLTFDWLLCTILHLGMNNWTYKVFWCIQGQHWSNRFRRKSYVVQVCCLLFLFFRTFTHCVSHVAIFFFYAFLPVVPLTPLIGLF